MSASEIPKSQQTGILGGGQLGRMLAQAGQKLGMSFRAFDPKADACAAEFADLQVAAFDDTEALESFGRGLALLTYEWENVPVEAAFRAASGGAYLFPSPTVLGVTQDRRNQKDLFRRLGVETADFALVSSKMELDQAVGALGFPSVLKTRRHGYDGKGQAVLRTPQDAEDAWSALGASPLILEKFVPFAFEASIVAARSRSGAIGFYPLTRNFHREGILRWSVAPAPGAGNELQKRAEAIAATVAEALGYVGTFAIEFFVVEGRLWVNEMAPRVHNSGHWTQDGSVSSQFENHLRAGAGMPLGPTSWAAGPVAGMVNLVGTLPDRAQVESVSGTVFHSYGKSAAPGRKIGHVNVLGNDLRELEARMNQVLSLCGEAPLPAFTRAKGLDSN